MALFGQNFQKKKKKKKKGGLILTKMRKPLINICLNMIFKQFQHLQLKIVFVACLRICLPKLFQKHDILNIYDSYKLELGVFMYKYFNGLLPMSFNAFFTKLSDIHMTQEINLIIIQQEIKRSLLTKQLELRDQSYGIL